MTHRRAIGLVERIYILRTAVSNIVAENKDEDDDDDDHDDGKERRNDEKQHEKRDERVLFWDGRRHCDGALTSHRSSSLSSSFHMAQFAATITFSTFNAFLP